MSNWTFRTYGLIEQYEISSAADLERIETLDEARWTATSAPTEQFNIDPVLLSFLDEDSDGRIRVRDLQAARRWLWGLLTNHSGIDAGSDTLILAHLSGEGEAPKIADLAEHLLGQLEEDETTQITLAQIRSFKASYAARYPNGDGVVTPAQLPESLQAVAEEVLTATAGALDLSGAVGVRAEDVKAWQERVTAWLAWHDRASSVESETLLPLGDDTAAAATLVEGLASKVEQYFAQCDLLRLEMRAVERLQATPEELAALDVSDPTAIATWLKAAPLATPDPTGLLPLSGAVNGQYAEQLEALSTLATWLLDIEEAEVIVRSQWDSIRAAITPFITWKADEPQGLNLSEGPDHLRAWKDSPLPGELSEMAKNDTDVADELVQFRSLEKLACYQHYLLLFANNFVSFPDLFDGNERALFEMGSLILDGRRINLCVKVTNVAAHKKIAAGSLMFVAYLALTRREGGVEKKETIAAAVTAGIRGGIDIGKRGVFYDREGKEWDAQIIDLIASPISIWEAMIAPFLRVRNSIADRIEATAAAQSKAIEAKLNEKTTAISESVTTPPASPTETAAPKPPPDGSSFTNLLMGGTIAFAAAGSALALVVQTIANISPLTILLTLLGVILMVMAIFGFLGWLKLRKRDVSTLLEACGFALNGRMWLSTHLADIFTQRPGLPEGARRRLMAPRSKLGILLLVVVLLIVALGIAAAVNPAVLENIQSLIPEPAVESPVVTPVEATPATP
ncbi:MAG: hypothetical protein ACI8RZ_000972 [Myxococcota bacterium]|jgi:hypothetical protein